MAQNFAKPDNVGASEAARRLGVTSQTVRDRIRAGSLTGRKDDRGRWRVPEDVLPVAPAALEDDPSIGARVDHLEHELAELRAAQDRGAHVSDALAAERDRYRAEAVAARDAAARLNIAVAEASATARSLLNALDAQTESLTQLLAPGSPADLP